MRQIPLAIATPPAPGFDNLRVGANAQAVQHLRGMTLPGAPVYLWGPTGSGKTHLMRALALQRQSQGEQVGWFDAADPLPWHFRQPWSLLVLDDCQALDSDHQQAAFALFIEAGAHGVQWLAAGRVPPVDLPLREDLSTRLAWGLVFAVQPLPEGEARAVLRREADRRGIFLSDEVMGYLLTRFERDLKHLMLLLYRLDEFGLAQQRGITVPLLKKMLHESEPGA